MDHEADRNLREREAGRLRKAEAIERKKIETELARQRRQEADERSYSNLFVAQVQQRKEKLAAASASVIDTKEGEGFDSDDDFM